MKDGVRGLPIENFGKKEWKVWLNNTVTVPDPHPCTAGNKEEEHFTINIFGNYISLCTIKSLYLS